MPSIPLINSAPANKEIPLTLRMCPFQEQMFPYTMNLRSYSHRLLLKDMYYAVRLEKTKLNKDVLPFVEIAVGINPLL